MKNEVTVRPIKGRGILIAEDCAIIRWCTAELLTLGGFDVLQAEDGSHALDLYREHQPFISLIVTDMMMPRMNGDQLCREIHQYDRQIPVILVSGSEDTDCLRNPAANGFFASFKKPTDYLGLIDTAKRALEGSENKSVTSDNLCSIRV